MRLKLYRAPTVAAAMTLVRAELGADALILATRRHATGVEVTAALEDATAAAPVRPDPARLELLRWHGVPGPLAEVLAAGPLESALGRRFRFEALPLGGGALLLAGPPGAGKTLTVVRLATRLVLDGRSPLVISTDTQRAGAGEQLGAFTRLLGVQLIEAGDAVSLARAVARRPADAPVLIDSAGIDPFSPADQAGIAVMAAAAGAVTALVLPAGLDGAEAADTASAFAAAGATLLLPTRLDLARRLGGVLAAAGAGLALTEAGVGAGAADGLQPLSPAMLAARLCAAQTRKAA